MVHTDYTLTFQEVPTQNFSLFMCSLHFIAPTLPPLHHVVSSFEITYDFALIVKVMDVSAW